MFRKILYILGGLLFVAAFVAAAGMGIWAYRLNAQLVQVQEDYRTLKSEYGDLGSEYSDAKAEFEEKSSQADAELEAAKAEITRLENDVEKLQNDNNRLRTKLAEIQEKVAMLSDFWFLSDSAFERKLDASDDERLKDLYAQMQETQDMGDLIEFMSYMIQSIDDVSSVSWQPIPAVTSHAETGNSQ